LAVIIGGSGMEYTLLGRTGFKVSRLGLGGAPLGGDFGTPVTERMVANVIDASLEMGINFIDTAPLYGHGESERRIGASLKGKREQFILATKAVTRGVPYTYENTLQSVESSLMRLQTDWIDLIQVHEPDTATFEQIMNETVPAFIKLKEAGKVRAFGINTANLSLLMRYMRTGIFDTLQFFARYMLIDHTAKDEVLPLARELNMGVINGSVLGMGILAGAPAEFLESHHLLLDEAKKRMDQLEFLRKSELSTGLIEPAMRFSLTCPDIAVTLTGTTSTRSLGLNASYCDGIGLTESEMNQVYALFQGQRLFN
jgi:L-galactose dehydrogenase